MPLFEFTIALGIIRACADMRHPKQVNEGPEIPGYKGRTVIRNDLRMNIRESFLRPLQDDFHIGLGRSFLRIVIMENLHTKLDIYSISF